MYYSRHAKNRIEMLRRLMHPQANRFKLCISILKLERKNRCEFPRDPNYLFIEHSIFRATTVAHSALRTIHTVAVAVELPSAAAEALLVACYPVRLSGEVVCHPERLFGEAVCHPVRVFCEAGGN